jgi:hypothetical protein
MPPFSESWEEQQRRRWIRPDAHLWIAANPERFGPLDPETRRIVDEEYERKHRCILTRHRAEKAQRDAHERTLIERMRIENEVLREEVQAIKVALLAAKANFNPAQPRDEIGRWTDAEGEQGGERVRLAASDRPTLGPHAVFAILAETARKLIEAYRSENGLWDLFGNSRGAVTVTTIDDVDIFVSNSFSPTYTKEDVVAAKQIRDRLVENYPDVFNTDDVTRLPNNAVPHAETTVLLRAARRNGGTLAGRTLDVFGDVRMCNNCEIILPYVGLELGNPRVTFAGPHGRYTMKDGIWISKEARR